MKIETVKISELELFDGNVRQHPQKQLDEMRRSVEMFGITRPMVIDENGTVLVGNGLLMTLQQMEVEEAPVYRMVDLSEADKKRLLLADNKVFDLGFTNYSNTEQILEELKDHSFNIPGYDDDTLHQMFMDSQELTEKAMHYGVLDTDRVEEVQAATERKDRRIEQARVEQKVEAQEAAQAEADERPFVVCPHCNEKIWL